jgi:hypothetical protein
MITETQLHKNMPHAISLQRYHSQKVSDNKQRKNQQTNRLEV